MTRRTVENQTVNRGVADLVLSLRALDEALFLMQRSDATVGIALEIWVELIQRTLTLPVHALFRERSQAATNNPTPPFFVLLSFCTFVYIQIPPIQQILILRWHIFPAKIKLMNNFF